MNKLKIMSFVWGFIVVILFGGLTTLGFIYKKKTEKYKKVEQNLVSIAKTYTATDFKFPVSGEKIVVTYKELSEKGLIDSLEVNGNKCDGYVLLTFDGVTKYKGFIKCDKYTTHGFEKDNLK